MDTGVYDQRASVRDQLAPLENLGPARADTTIRTLAAYLDEQGSVVKTAERLPCTATR